MSDLTTEDLRAHYAARVAAFRPLNDQVLVQLEHHLATASHPIPPGDESGNCNDVKTPGGIYIPSSIEPDVNGVRYARVVAIGPGLPGKGSARLPMDVAVGDRVVLDEIVLRGPFPEVAPGWHVAHNEQLLGVVEP
jgi:co-chaperonin GroES (HSP10)